MLSRRRGRICTEQWNHLATRMRRNAGSLLVLVGEHSPRRWSGTVGVGDVLRSAFAEVEDYRRVVLRRIDEAAVRGDAAAEISHLPAELVENALSFSPPDREVEVQARASGEDYHIAIVDHGIGMTPEAMATANLRLRGEQSFLVAPARDLGHRAVRELDAGRSAPDGDPETTVNGLVKRRARHAGRKRGDREPVRRERPAAPDLPARPPEAVRSMLGGFRAGVRRGERQERPTGD